MMNLICVGLVGICVGLVGVIVKNKRRLNKAVTMAEIAVKEGVKSMNQTKTLLEDYKKLSDMYKEAKQKEVLYGYLLCDVQVAYYSNEDIVTYKEILDEYGALLEGKTTGYVYTGEKEYDDKLLEGYERPVCISDEMNSLLNELLGTNEE